MVNAAIGQENGSREHLKIAQQYFQLVGGSASGQVHHIFLRLLNLRIFPQNSSLLLFCSAHRTLNFTNPQFQFPQLKVLQSVFFFLI